MTATRDVLMTIGHEQTDRGGLVADPAEVAARLPRGCHSAENELSRFSAIDDDPDPSGAVSFPTMPRRPNQG
jgi:hypothetical protein